MDSGGPLGASPKGGSSRFGSPAPFLQCEPHLTSGGSGVLSDPARIDEEFRKNSILRMRSGCHFYLRFTYLD